MQREVIEASIRKAAKHDGRLGKCSVDPEQQLKKGGLEAEVAGAQSFVR